ncbi:MAG: ECF-type sigma factor [Planctomycetota bacterium]
MTPPPAPPPPPADGPAEGPATSGELFARLYGELRRLAVRVAGRGAGELTLSPTALVHEAWIKLARPGSEAEVEDRSHFLNLAARAMRQVLVSHAREQGAAKRGGGRARERFTVVLGGTPAAERGVDVLDLDDALERLAALDARQARVAELRLFAGLSPTEIAPLLGVAPRTVELDWRMAKDHLARVLGGEGSAAP